MKLSPFTLVHQRHSEEGIKAADLLPHGGRAERTRVRHLLNDIKPSYMRTLLSSAVARKSAETGGSEGSRALKRIATHLSERQDAVAVGVWDLDVRIGFLPNIIERLNGAQGVFTFFEVQAAVPAGLVSRPERIASWALEHTGRILSKKELGGIGAAVIDDDYFRHAQTVRRDLGIDYLVGITRALVAGRDDVEGISWTRLSSSSGRAGRGRLLLTSAAELRGQTGQAGRPFESEAMMSVVTHLLIALGGSGSQLRFHEEVNGCVFDRRQRRSSAGGVSIEPTCLSLVPAKYRDAASEVIRALQTYEGVRR